MNLAYHLRCDSLGSYKRNCSTTPPGFCDTFNSNEVCIRTSLPNTAPIDTCLNLADPAAQVVGGDASAYFTMGVTFNIPEVGIENYAIGTNGWAGPYPVFLPDNGDPLTGSNSTTTAIRYANGYQTSILQPPDGCDFVNYDDCMALFGPEAVKSTIDIQNVKGIEEDPNAYALGTCAIGNAKPVLPRLNFEYIMNKDGVEVLDTSFSFKLFVRK